MGALGQRAPWRPRIASKVITYIEGAERRFAGGVLDGGYNTMGQAVPPRVEEKTHKTKD